MSGMQQACRPCGLQANSCAARPPATLPSELWEKVWDGVDKCFHTKERPKVHMEGACKCGKLQFRVDGTLAAAFWCHCHMCRMHWTQVTPSHTLWIQPETACTFTSGQEYLAIRNVEKLSRNLRGNATVNFCMNCATNINVEFSDPNGIFTLMWPYNFNHEEWGDTSGKGDKARHGYAEMFRPRFHAHYENRAVDVEDGLPKLADIWLDGMPLMNNAGENIGKVTYPMPGFENGWTQAPVVGNSKTSATPVHQSETTNEIKAKALEALASAITVMAKL